MPVALELDAAELYLDLCTWPCMAMGYLFLEWTWPYASLFLCGAFNKKLCTKRR